MVAPSLEKLFEPVSISEVEVRNRIVMSSMCTYFAAPDGSVTERLVSFFEARAKGGIGLIVTGYTFVGGESSRHLGNQMGMHCDRMIPQLNHLVERVRAYGAKIFVQLNHYGRKLNGRSLEESEPEWTLSSGKDRIQPTELSANDIESLVNLYGKAAERAKLAGFDGVEIDGTSAGLINAFMLGQMNKRSDRYGGDIEGRMRFAKEVIECVRHFVGESFPVGFRFDVGDDLYFLGGKGLTFSEGQKIAVLLENHGVDYLNTARVMLPLYVKQTFKGAEMIKRKVQIPVVAVGSVIEPRMAERLLRSGKADLVALGRSLIADPEWPRKAKEGRDEDICRCIRCNDCIDRHRRYQALKCTVNVRVGSESQIWVTPADVRKKIAVIGGGPAGMEASLAAALRGYEVALFERKAALGGNLLPGSRPKFKADIRSLVEQFRRRIGESTVKVLLENEATAETISKAGFDVVILAAGSKPKPLDIPIERRDGVYTTAEILSDPEIELGEKVAVVGGGVTGCEVAVFMAKKGIEVVLLEALDEILTDERVDYNRMALTKMLKMEKVEVRTGVNLKKITKEGLNFLDANGKEVLLPADSIVTAVGSEPNRDILEDLERRVHEVHCIGDCVSPRKIYHAIHEGFEAGSLI